MGAWGRLDVAVVSFGSGEGKTSFFFLLEIKLFIQYVS